MSCGTAARCSCCCSPSANTARSEMATVLLAAMVLATLLLLPLPLLLLVAVRGSGGAPAIVGGPCTTWVCRGPAGDRLPCLLLLLVCRLRVSSRCCTRAPTLRNTSKLLGLLGDTPGSAGVPCLLGGSATSDTTRTLGPAPVLLLLLPAWSTASGPIDSGDTCQRCLCLRPWSAAVLLLGLTAASQATGKPA